MQIRVGTLGLTVPEERPVLQANVQPDSGAAPEEALPKPQPWGRLQRPLSPQRWGELCRIGLEVEVLEINSQVEGTWRGHGSVLREPHSEGGKGDSGPVLRAPSLRGRRTHKPYLQRNTSLREEAEAQAWPSEGP